MFHSTYPQSEIDKEVEVICDEIDSYKDSPAELIFDEFESMMYAGQPLGRDILGSAERLRQYTTADACRFARAHYRPDNAAFYVYGDVPFSQIVRTLNKLLPAATCGENVQNSAQPVSLRHPPSAWWTRAPTRPMCWWAGLPMPAPTPDALPLSYSTTCWAGRA